jgi:tetratricopeptide (TPR) repeat protein
MTLEEIEKETRRLNNEKQFDEVLSLLTPEVLAEHNSIDLYFQHGFALSGKKEYEKSIESYSQSIALGSQDASAFNNRGVSWQNRGFYDKAIEDYDKAIKLEPNNAIRYYNKGNALGAIGDNPQAIENYSKAIELNPDYVSSLINRGLCWREQGFNDKAMEDYNRAIEVNPNYSVTYNNRGYLNYRLKNIDAAIDDFSKAIALAPEYLYAYTNRGNAYTEKKEYENAIKDYRKALEIDPEFENAKEGLNLLLNKSGVAVNEGQSVPDTSLDYLNKEVQDITDKDDRANILKAGAGVKTTIDEIRKHVFFLSKDNITHYTKLKVADILTSDPQKNEEIKFRYYNVVYMNDPNEGRIVFDWLGNKKIENCFRKGKQEEENNVYLGSFLPESHEDDLVMWRTYAKDENRNEAVGCSILIAHTFFESNNKYFQEALQSEDITQEVTKNASGEALYKVLYFDRLKKNIVGQNARDSKKLQEFRDKLLSGLNNIIALKNRNTADKIDKIVYRFISEIRYLFKSADYQFENEIRVIKYRSPESEDVKIDSTCGIPKRLYIESVKPVQPHLRKIILGPKVPSPKQWVYLDVVMRKKNFPMELKQSTCKFQ